MEPNDGRHMIGICMLLHARTGHVARLIRAKHVDKTDLVRARGRLCLHDGHLMNCCCRCNSNISLCVRESATIVLADVVLS